tara:strand:- start:381 stop:620 length:240 start_codon:yes stop_codon:yes gene_type:complete
VTAPLIKENDLTVRDAYIESILEGISDLEFLKDNLDELSDNFTPTEKDKEKTYKILYHIKTALNLSESQNNQDGPGQED